MNLLKKFQIVLWFSVIVLTCIQRLINKWNDDIENIVMRHHLKCIIFFPDAIDANITSNEELGEGKNFLVNLSLLALIGAAIGVAVLITLLACLCARRRHAGRKPSGKI